MTDSRRREVINRFIMICTDYPEWNEKYTKDETESLVRRMERSCFNYAVNECEEKYIQKSWQNPLFLQIYNSVCYKCLSNLDSASSVNSTNLINMLINEDVLPSDIASLSSEIMNPEAARKERDELDTRRKQKRNLKFTTRYPCPKCKAKKVNYYEVQLRGADEASDNHCICLECGNEWVAAY